MSEQSIFATLRGNTRIWAVGAIHGEAERLVALHQQLAQAFQVGDQIVYLGNYLGQGPAVRQTIDELLLFRRAVLARPGVECEDIVFLRGAQEEMWHKLQQLQFAPGPVQVLQWMLAQGVQPTIEAYGSRVDEAIMSARDGILSLTRWTSLLRQSMRNFDGHNALMSSLRHAAFTENECLLFVHAGLDPQRPLSAQSDSFWWGNTAFSTIETPYCGFHRVVRGFDWKHGGVQETPYTITLDAGCGFGGTLLAACFGPDGGLVQTLQG